jgi:hypothetical protein
VSDTEDWAGRRHRHDVDLEVQVRYGGGHVSRALINNLSLDGCRIIGWFRIGEQLNLSIPGIGLVHGQVRWAIGGEAGIRFHSKDEAGPRVVQSAFS